jgi:hypothetical protein
MLEIIIGQSNLRLFFVDWDKARGKLQPIRKGKSMRQSQRDRDSKSGQMSSDDAVMAPLSIWRTLFAANEWSELQTLRSTSLELTLFGIMAILHGECQSSLSVLWVSLGHSLLSQLLLDSPRAHAHFFFTCVHVITFSSDEAREVDGADPAKDCLRLGGIAEKLLDLGGAEVRGVHLDEDPERRRKRDGGKSQKIV